MNDVPVSPNSKQTNKEDSYFAGRKWN